MVCGGEEGWGVVFGWLGMGACGHSQLLLPRFKNTLLKAKLNLPNPTQPNRTQPNRTQPTSAVSGVPLPHAARFSSARNSCVVGGSPAAARRSASARMPSASSILAATPAAASSALTAVSWSAVRRPQDDRGPPWVPLLVGVKAKRSLPVAVVGLVVAGGWGCCHQEDAVPLLLMGAGG